MDFQTNEVYSIKLNSGEELVCKISAINGDFISVSQPLSVAPGPQGIGLMPSMFTADPQQNTEINTKTICLACLTDESVRAKYIQATTGIQMPDKRMILG
jgi:hypothetical protein